MRRRAPTLLRAGDNNSSIDLTQETPSDSTTGDARSAESTISSSRALGTEENSDEGQGVSGNGLDNIQTPEVRTASPSPLSVDQGTDARSPERTSVGTDAILPDSASIGTDALEGAIVAADDVADDSTDVSANTQAGSSPDARNPAVSPASSERFSIQFNTVQKELQKQLAKSPSTATKKIAHIASTYLNSLEGPLKKPQNDESSQVVHQAQLAAHIDVLRSLLQPDKPNDVKTAAKYALTAIKEYLTSQSRSALIKRYFGWVDVNSNVKSFMQGNYGSDDVQRRARNMSQSPSRARSTSLANTPPRSQSPSHIPQETTLAELDPQERVKDRSSTTLKITPRGIPSPQKEPVEGQENESLVRTSNTSNPPPKRQDTGVFNDTAPARATSTGR